MEEEKLNHKRVKTLFRQFGDIDKTMKISKSASSLITDVTTEFFHMIALAALDRSERPHQYMDSIGLVKALVDLGFPDIAAELTNLDEYTEDMVRK